MKYQIIAQTRPWRNKKVASTTYKVIDNLSLRVAQEELIRLFNHCYETSYNRWNHIRQYYPNDTMSYRDNSRAFTYDETLYQIIPDYINSPIRKPYGYYKCP